jgi:hypothetical protein
MSKLLNGSSGSAVCRRCNSRNRTNLTPRQEQVESWCTPAGTGPGSTQNLVRAKAQAQAERLCRPLTLRQNPTGKTQKKQKSEANDPQQGWEEAVTPLNGHPLNAVTILNDVLFFCVCWRRRFPHNAYAAPAYRSTPPLALPGEAIAYVALSSKHDGHMQKRAGRKANSPPGIFSGTCRAGCGRDRDRFGDCRCLNGS